MWASEMVQRAKVLAMQVDVLSSFLRTHGGRRELSKVAL